MCGTVCAASHTPITFETVIHRKKKNSVLMPTTQCNEEKMFCGLSPPSAVAVVATVVMMGGGTVTDATASLPASISVASCRAACLHVFTSSGAERDARCRRNSDCFMCWNSCGILRHHSSAWSSMCTDHTACFHGCQVACRFYLNKAPEGTGSDLPYTGTSPSLTPAHQPPPRVSGRNQVTWSSPEWPGSIEPSSHSELVYVLMVQGDGGWRELTQTSSSRARIPASVEGVVRAKLLAVNQEGLVAASDALLHLDGSSKGYSNFPKDHLHNYEDLLALENRHNSGSSSQLPYGYKLETTEQAELPPTTGTPRAASSELLPQTESTTSSTTHSSITAHLHYDYATSNPSPPTASIDPSWKVEISDVEVQNGPLAEVSVWWSPRGSGGVEYLLSWAEESGFVSGHLLTDQLTSQLSLWQGQGYYLQVELVDSQGNSVLKSSATPVVFNPTTTQDRQPPSPSIVTASSTSASSTTPTTTTGSKLPTHVVTQEVSNKPKVMWHTSPRSSISHEDQWEFLQDHTQNQSSPGPHERSHISTDLEILENLEILNNSIEITTFSQDISGTETLTRDERVYHVVVWCIGVGVGALLLLTLCSMVIWMLNRCRKSKQKEELSEEELHTKRGSFRTFTPQQNVRNQTTSWTFENFCSVNRKSKLEPSRRDAVPVGIDNDSLMENYVFMLDAQSGGTFIKH
ncbi:uncharacterized protein LOC123518624 [Portunus trituberculatus]|uniref:uncharacterized protein LOC123518624 n=1 Tax=Portunus trituberculatus TaxID=210409 RepID=UPI001E1D04BC|nr:uncharacterized protein LOC123518624 [Portunus trituberculatus]